MRTPIRFAATVLALSAAVSAHAQKGGVLGDLDPASRVTLGKDELTQLMTGAKMRRSNQQGSYQQWTNETGGSFVVSSDNTGTQGQNSTAPGKWKISDDGRYCVTIEWKRNPTEDWCRVIIKSGDGYYAAKSDKVETERLFKFDITK